MHTYEVKIRLDGRVSKTLVQASDAGHATKLSTAALSRSRTPSVSGNERVTEPG